MAKVGELIYVSAVSVGLDTAMAGNVGAGSAFRIGRHGITWSQFPDVAGVDPTDTLVSS